MSINKLKDRVEECYTIAEKYYGRKFDRVPLAIKNCGTTGGYVTHRIKFIQTPTGYLSRINFPSSITFNATLYAQNEETYMKEVIPHEVAHVIDLYINGSTGHRKNWKTIMEHVFKIQPKRTHNMDTSTSAKRKVNRNYVYTCACREHSLTKILHNKIQMGRNRQCKLCKTIVKFKEMA